MYIKVYQEKSNYRIWANFLKIFVKGKFINLSNIYSNIYYNKLNHIILL